MEVMRVLCVDDQTDIVDLTATFLERIGESLSVTTATSATKGLEQIETKNVDCIVSDYDMPGKNGLEFLEAVRDEYPDLPFILFTGKGSEEIASKAITAGVTDYLQKGGGRDRYTLLVNRIRNYVDQDRTRRALRVSEAQLETIMNTFPDLVFLLDAEGTYLEAVSSPELESRYYVEPEQFLGRRLHDVLPTEAADSYLSTISRALDTGEIQTLDYQLTVPAGTRWFEGRIAPIEDDRKDDAVVWVSRDITDRKRYEQSLTALHTATGELFKTTSEYEVSQCIIEIASEVLDFTAASVYLYDSTEGALTLSANSSDTEALVGDLPRESHGDGVVWQVYETGESMMIEGSEKIEAVYQETPIRSELLVPIGEYGVFVAGGTDTGAFDEQICELAEMLIATATPAFGRVTSTEPSP